MGERWTSQNFVFTVARNVCAEPLNVIGVGLLFRRFVLAVEKDLFAGRIFLFASTAGAPGENTHYRG